MQAKIVAMLAVVIVVGAGAWYAYQLDKPEPVETLPPEVVPQAIIREEPPAVEEEPEQVEPSQAQSVAEEFVPKAKIEPIVQPPERVPGSDAVVFRAVEDLGENLPGWLTPSDQIDKWVLAVDLVAGGNIPSKHLPVAINLGKFKVVNEGDAVQADAANYQRADALINVITAIPPQRLAQYYKAWRPLLEQSYRELGKPGSFDERLKVAIDEILATQKLPANAELVQPKVLYQYADPALEKAHPVSRWLWRLGPDNSHKIKLFLMELKPLL